MSAVEDAHDVVDLVFEKYDPLNTGFISEDLAS